MKRGKESTSTIKYLEQSHVSQWSHMKLEDMKQGLHISLHATSYSTMKKDDSLSYTHSLNICIPPSSTFYSEFLRNVLLHTMKQDMAPKKLASVKGTGVTGCLKMKVMERHIVKTVLVSEKTRR